MQRNSLNIVRFRFGYVNLYYDIQAGVLFDLELALMTILFIKGFLYGEEAV